MTEAELDELLAACPVLFHMAEAGAWDSIRAHGLLSTSALLDLCGLEGAARAPIEAARRPKGVRLQAPDGTPITIRDNGPMSDAALERCLTDGLSPADWYRLLNRRVFLWPSRARLDKLLAARTYRDRPHDILHIESRPLVEAYRDRITLSPINSGATSRFPAPRGLATFRTISEAPWEAWRRTRARRGAVVELCIEGGVPDIARFTVRVTREVNGAEALVVFVRGRDASKPRSQHP